MPPLTDVEMLEELKNFDTPSITNIVATDPKNPLCLGLYSMDENGAVKFPVNRLEEVLLNARQLQKDEEARMTALQSAKSAAEVRAIFAGHTYGTDQEKDG